ncbi:MAG TPA: hypothetical protein VET48_02715, partial [Steroidobacteraceae bacterium]|nr:hypothetical protein [Steroidobacteraceae bacterium]
MRYHSLHMAMQSRDSTAKTVGLGAFGSLAASAVTLLIQAVVGERLGRSGVALLAAVAAFAVLLPVVLAMARLYRTHVEAELRPAVEKEVSANIRAAAESQIRSELAHSIGLVGVFSSFREAEAEILEMLAKSRDVRVFIQFGRAVLSGVTLGTSNFYDYLGDSKLEREASVKILHAAADSPYLTARAAALRGSDYAEWRRDIEYTAAKCDVLAKKLAGSRVTFSSRSHKEGFLWRLFILDDVAYVQPYLHQRKNAAQSPVLKITKTFASGDVVAVNDNSLYKVFSDFFNFKWEENRPEETSLAQLTREGGIVTVAALTHFRQFYVFIVPMRYVQRGGRDLPFHGIGGKKQENEEWLAALQRESREEVGVGLHVANSSHTRFYTTGAELGTIGISDTPRPYCVYKRIRENDPYFAHPEVLWLVGYEAALDASDFVGPQHEAAAVLY